MPRQRSRSPLSPTLATESATVRLFICVGVLKAGLKTETGFCTVCDFAHARPIMLSILLVIGANRFSQHIQPASDRDRVSPAESAFWYHGKCCDDDLGLQTRGRRAFPASAR